MEAMIVNEKAVEFLGYSSPGAGAGTSIRAMGEKGVDHRGDPKLQFRGFAE